jgi:hypothetical protein
MLFDESELQWACARKKVYTNQKLARSVARKVHDTRGLRVREYQCRFCWQWHLTKAGT